MTAGRPKRRTTKEAASGGVISTAHGASWFLLCASLFYALQEDFLPTAATSRFAAVVAAVIGMLYLPTFGGQLFKLIKQKWLWCNDFFAGVTVLFGGHHWPMQSRLFMQGRQARNLASRLRHR